MKIEIPRHIIHELNIQSEFILEKILFWNIVISSLVKIFRTIQIVCVVFPREDAPSIFMSNSIRQTNFTEESVFLNRHVSHSFVIAAALIHNLPPVRVSTLPGLATR